MILTLELIKEVIRSQDRVVRYEPGETICPTCSLAGLQQSKILVSCTCGEIRYCSCETCGTTFRAAGAPAKAKPKPEAVKSTRKKVKKAGDSTEKADKKTLVKDNKDNKVKKKRTRKKKEKLNGNEK